MDTQRARALAIAYAAKRKGAPGLRNAAPKPEVEAPSLGLPIVPTDKIVDGILAKTRVELPDFNNEFPSDSDEFEIDLPPEEKEPEDIADAILSRMAGGKR